MVESTELMRGDYVRFFDTHKIGKIAKVDQVLRHSCLLLYNEGPDDKFFEDEIIVNYENIHPIEVNDEFLKAHGFVVDDTAARLEYQHEGLRRYFYLTKEYDKEAKKGIERYYVGEDNYTNKLHLIQHDMRLRLMDEFEI